MVRSSEYLKIYRDENTPDYVLGTTGTTLLKGLNEPRGVFPDELLNVCGNGLLCAFNVKTLGVERGLGMERADIGRMFFILESGADFEAAKQMKAYMRDQFSFLGIATPRRRKFCEDFLRAAASQEMDWRFVEQCWARTHREFQYLGVDYLGVMKDKLSPPDIPKLERIAVAKSWWDTIDGLDRVVGHIALAYPETNEVILEWSAGENVWLRRIAIDHQLARKEMTDTALLERVILNNLGQKEFFINKAIGWSLREYSKTNPAWVKDFIERNEKGLSRLSVREASKHLTRAEPEPKLA
ncbi:MAG: DNA alkylation repair protein [Synergistaceae bacterium]|jgi:3-methyladenine DNA glycosylase AlkD|nr:DNA alkylation repair protein [Synergistaceae bacterium]